MPIESNASNVRELVVGKGTTQALTLDGSGCYRIVVEAGAHASLVELPLGADRLEIEVLLHEKSHLHSTCLALGRESVRCEIDVRFAGPGAVCQLDGLYVGDGAQRLDLVTRIDHAVPGCESHQRYKGILGGHARSSFIGTVLVRPGAQQTQATQVNPNLLLSRDAHAETRPQLEILADDVKCTHGATVGRLDAEALFFLRSRGIGHEEAQAMLVRAFAHEILDGIGDKETRERAQRLFDARGGSRGRHAV